MRKLLILFLILPFAVFAKYNTGTITFNDGSTKSGLIEIPEGDNLKIKFKADDKAKVEKFKVEDVKSFQVLNDKNETDNYITLRVGNNKVLNPKKFNINEHKSFVKIVKQGKISVYLIHFIATSVSGSTYHTTTNNGADAYYLQRENEDFAFAIGIHRYDLKFMVGFDLFMVTEFNFREICPEFSQRLKEANLNSNDYYKIVDIYEANCGKK